MGNGYASFSGMAGASGGGSGSNASVGPTGGVAPTNATEVGFVDSSGNLQPFAGSSAASGPNVVISSSALPVGGATAALQTSGNAQLVNIASNQTNGTQVTAVNSSALPTGASTSANQATEITALQAIEANQTNGTQHTIVDSSALPTGGATSANQATEITALQAIQANQTNGTQQVNIPDTLVTGQSAQTATVNNILTVASGTAATSTNGIRSATVQVVSTGTGGSFIFEGSNDNVNFQTIPVINQNSVIGNPLVAAITATASQVIYTFPVTTAFLRLRIATTITGGSIQAFTRLSPETWIAPVQQVAQNTAGNLNTTATIASGTVTTVGTVTSVTSANSAIPGIIADVTSAAIITTTTTATITPTFGSSYAIDIPVTVVTGTLPTMSVAVQESMDSGTNWFTVYTFPTIITTGSYSSPVMTMQGNRIRYVQTISGTSPSFTRAINRLQSSQGGGFNAPTPTIFTDRSGSTSATPSTSTLVAAANGQRRYFIIQNLSTTATIFINFTAAAAATGSLMLLPGGSYTMENNTITSEAINVFSATASVAFASKEG